MNKTSDAKVCDAIRQAILRLPRATDAAVIDRATAALGIERRRVELAYEANFGLKDAN
jgi:hypothetical protein